MNKGIRRTMMSVYLANLESSKKLFFIIYRNKYRSYSSGDRKKYGVEIDFSLAWMIDKLHNNKCFYCERRVVLGLDRIDNRQGHIKLNVLPCCRTCNCIRGNYFTVEQTKEVINTAKKFYVDDEYAQFNFYNLASIEEEMKIEIIEEIKKEKRIKSYPLLIL